MNIFSSSIANSITKIDFNQELHLFFERIQKTHSHITWVDFRRIILSFIDDIKTPLDMVYFFQFIRQGIGGVQGSMNNEKVELLDAIFERIITKKRELFQSNNWNSKYIWSLFHNLRNYPNIPIEFFEDIGIIVEGIDHWSWNHISETLRTLELYRNTEYGEKFIKIIGRKIFLLNIDTLSFKTIQPLIINLEHLDVEIPEVLENRWNALQNEVGDKNYISTTNEERIVKSILANVDDFEWFSIEQNVFLCGYEIDIIIYDTQGAIFAIIESDGRAHERVAKTRNKDIRRDVLFLRRGITDTIIHCKNIS